MSYNTTARTELRRRLTEQALGNRSPRGEREAGCVPRVLAAVSLPWLFYSGRSGKSMIESTSHLSHDLLTASYIRTEF